MASTPFPAEAERRARLLGVKLRALLKRYWPEAEGAEPISVAGGMAVHLDERAWALVDDTDSRKGFGRALLWGLHRGVTELHVLVDHSPAVVGLARQAAAFRTSVTVWAVEGAEIERVDPEPLPPEPGLDPRAEPFVAVIEAAGAEPVVEWGTLHAEVLGLEVGRVFTDADGASLEVGVGKHDRLGHQLLWGEQASAEALPRVVAIALQARRSGDLGHPLNRIGRERWLRHRIVQEPNLIGAGPLNLIGPPVPLQDLRVPLLAPAKGTAEDGGGVVVSCSIGFDPTFVPMAAELHAARGDDGTKLVLVLPEGDVHPLMRQAAADIQAEVTVRTVPDDWYLEIR
ncbi:MAG: hypothetical protein M3179_12910 [Actinomycetota bacterium]|nr:hypothetical protein [Actinomycetota bacterium]